MFFLILLVWIVIYLLYISLSTNISLVNTWSKETYSSISWDTKRDTQQ